MNFDVDIIFKIAAIGIAVAVLSQILTRAGREDQALMTTLAGIVIVIILVVQMIAELFDTLRSLFGL
ncbi:MAG: stage III sporulation protein AC [Firmicutes bacterium]|nr:stage III sporulation protein AC [Bacillota bacterium]